MAETTLVPPAPAPVPAPAAPVGAAAPPPPAFAVALVNGGPVKRQGARPEEFRDILEQSSLAWVDFTLGDMGVEAPEIAGAMGFSQSLVTQLLSNRFSGYEDLETELGILVPVIRVEKLDVRVYRLLFLVRRGVIVTLHPPEVVRMGRFYRYADVYMRKIKGDLSVNDKVSAFLTRLIDENNNGNFNGLRKIEEEGDEIGKFLLDPQSPRGRLAEDIYNMKHALITYLNILWASLDVVNDLRYGDAELITDNPKLLARIGVAGDDINRQIALSEHMSEVLASGLEVLQTIYNNQLTTLNNRLTSVTTWLAILATAVMVPNTLATVLGSPAFGLGAADRGWFLGLVAVSTLLSAVAVFAVIRWRGGLPRIGT
ncbi:MAG: magnesium transporter CorA [Euryarchaeota archaeon]|nr:magnesium transporter CorA [Euryarchaeota archaeon]